MRVHAYIYVYNIYVYRYVDLNADDMYERILDRPRSRAQSATA